jgi:hypothetical protein
VYYFVFLKLARLQVLRLSSLESLSLAANRLEVLDPKLGACLPGLTTLCVRANFLRDLPDALAALGRLVSLQVDTSEHERRFQISGVSV